METCVSREEQIRAIVIEAVARSCENVLRDFEPEPAWGRPLVGFAAGDDPLFEFFKDDIGEFYWTPAEIFGLTFDPPAAESQPAPVQSLSVISWVIPQTRKTRRDQRVERRLPSERWIRSRAYWPELTRDVHETVVKRLAADGVRSVAPELSPHWGLMDSEKYGFASNWSQRHTAYVAGLGTFGLSDGLITPVGKAMRAGSLVVEASLAPTPRRYAGHHDWCLFYVDGSCGECIGRCPAGAITRRGHDKVKCDAYQSDVVRAHATATVGDRIAGCGLCQTGVQCEGGVPRSLGVR